MENILTTKNVMDFVDKKIFKINWDNKYPIYETKNFDLYSSSNNDSNIGLVIDNGSYECRAGWSTNDEPNLRFKSIVAKPKVQLKHEHNEFLVGNEILSYEQGKLHKKSPFEKNIVTHFGTQEHILDHAFSTLSIDIS
jgi:actin-related protein 5